MDLERLYPFWTMLSGNEKELVEHSCRIERFGRGRRMYHSAENCKGLMSILSGQLRVYIVSEEGREVTLFRVPEGETCALSASCLMDSIDFDIIIEAAEETEVAVLPAMPLNTLMKENPYVELYLYKAATAKFSEVMWTLQKILFQKIDQRIAGFLWDEHIRLGATELRLTHDEIAQNIGSAREVVTRVLKYLSENGAVDLGRGKIIIKDKEKLKKYL